MIRESEVMRGSEDMRRLTVAAIQMACTDDKHSNISKAVEWVKYAAAKGAQVILLQELFETPYFCQIEKLEYTNLATTVHENEAIKTFQELAKMLSVVIPISFYERSNNALFNSVAMIDADGSILGTYRKSHIPDGPGYEEKFYFNGGDTGFKVWQTQYGKIGVGICWDQWFPESARIMSLMGAELLLYPTAIGSEPEVDAMDSKDHWQRCMQGHAAANIVPVVASNRIGKEVDGSSEIVFYGSSFITDERGAILKECSRTQEEAILHTFNLDDLYMARMDWGVFRDRRPDLYKPLLTLDGVFSK